MYFIDSPGHRIDFQVQETCFTCISLKTHNKIKILVCCQVFSCWVYWFPWYLFYHWSYKLNREEKSYKNIQRMQQFRCLLLYVWHLNWERNCLCKRKKKTQWLFTFNFVKWAEFSFLKIILLQFNITILCSS